MVSSQDTASAVALRALGYEVTSALEVLLITHGRARPTGRSPCATCSWRSNGKKLPTGDVNEASEQLTLGDPGDAGRAEGQLTVLRDGKEVDVPVTPEPGENGEPAGRHPARPGLRAARSRSA